MAKYIGLLTADARGKVGGIILSRSTGSTTIKGHRAPKRPTTILQQRAQNNILAALLSWRGLSVNDQQTWNIYAQGTTYTNSLGTGYSPTGQQLYTQAWVNGASTGFTPSPSLNPLTILPPPIFELAVQRPFGGLTVTAGTAFASYPSRYIFSCSCVISSSVNYVRSARMLILAAPTSGVPWDFSGQYITAYGVLPPVGARLAVKGLPVDEASMISGATTILPVDVTT